jgi:hypothetical protein
MPHYLVHLSNAEFAAIASKVVPRTVRLKDPTLAGAEASSWILSGYCERLLYKNAGLQHLLSRFVGKYDHTDCRESLTRGQRILLSLSALDGQVRNGGITQFFWNCPDLIFEACESLETAGPPELTAAYRRALEALIGSSEDWTALRTKSSIDSSRFWESFQASYDLLDLNWFDDAYFEQNGDVLAARLVNYVQTHKAEFIETGSE